MSFVSVNSGWALADGAIFGTADGGRTWKRAGSAPAGVSNIGFAAPNIGYAWHYDGPLWMTSDGGRVWRRGNLAQVVYLEVGAGAVWAVTGPLPGPRVWRSAVGGSKWKSLGLGPDRSATLDVHGSLAYVTGQQGASPDAPALTVWSTDGSRRIERLPCDRSHRVVPESPLGVSTDGVVVLICNEQVGQRTRALAYASSDEGRSWRSLPGPPAAPIDVTGTRAGVFAWASKVLLLHGGSWQTKLAPEGQHGFKSVGFVTDEFGVAVTRKGELFRTQDGGFSWQLVRVD